MNQIKIDDDLLKELGLDKFSDSDKDKMLRQIYEALELRMGLRLAKTLTEDQLFKFEELTKNGSHDEAAQWLKQYVPNYQQMASEELDDIKRNVRETSRNILEQSV